MCNGTITRRLDNPRCSKVRFACHYSLSAKADTTARGILFGKADVNYSSLTLHFCHVLSRNHFTTISNTLSRPTLRVARPPLRGLAGQDCCLNTLILYGVRGGAPPGLPPPLGGERGSPLYIGKIQGTGEGFTRQHLSEMHSGYHICFFVIPGNRIFSGGGFNPVFFIFIMNKGRYP